MNSIVFLICSLLAFVIANGQSTSSNIKLELFQGSGPFWIGIAVQNANVDTTSVQIKDSFTDSVYTPMSPNPEWGFWTLTTPTGVPYKFPISVLITSVNGDSVTADFASLSTTSVDTGKQYGTISAAPAQVSATAVPLKVAPVFPTAAPSLGCAAPLKLLVPLYTYPDAGWDLVAAGAAFTPTVAIVNPNSGPGNGPDDVYNTYMAKLHDAGVEMVGYVHTSYGARSLAAVKADIDKYASEFPHISGIFLDESASNDGQLPYYIEIYNYIMSFPGWKYDIINPGTVTTSGYLRASTQIVAFENEASKFPSSSNPSYASCATKDRFAMIAYGATQNTMAMALSAAKAKGYYGWVYVTDGAAGGTTYNVLTSYYSAQANYLKASINI